MLDSTCVEHTGRYVVQLNLRLNARPRRYSLGPTNDERNTNEAVVEPHVVANEAMLPRNLAAS